jgi:hypothetical protein
LTVTDRNTAGGDPLDLMIDKIVARRAPGSAAGEPAPARLGGDEALIAELCSLGEIYWPADEIGDRIAENVAAAVGQRGVVVQHGPAAGGVQRRRRRVPARRAWSGRSRWIAAGAAAAVALAVAGVVQLTGSPHGASHLSGPGAVGQKKITRTTPPAKKSHGATRTWLTAMRIVGQAGALKAIGTANMNDNFLTCVTSSVCYTLGAVGQSEDIARSVNGGVTWTSGEPLPPNDGQFDTEAAVSCPQPLACFLPYGNGLLETSDGFAHFQVLPVTTPSGSSDTVSIASCSTMQHCVAALDLSSTGQPFVYSDDGGASWAAATSPPVSADDIIGGLRCDPGGACIAAVIAGDETNPLVAALSSTDGGRSWTMSRTYSIVDQQVYMVSCGDGRNCLIGSKDGYLAWIHSAAGGRISIRVQAFPHSWGTTGIDLSCATGLDCFVETGSQMLEATRDGGLTWTATPLAPSVPQDIAVYLSCPVAAGCIGLADDGSGDQSSWVVLSNLSHAR